MNLRVLNSGSTGNAYVLMHEDRYLILDAGVHAKEIMRAVDSKPTSISGVLITHEHMDHCKAVTELLARGVNVYCSEGTASALGVSKHHKVHVMAPKKAYSINGAQVMGFPVVHDAKEPMGFLIRWGTDKIVYATDTAYIQYQFKGLTHLIVECNYMSEALKRQEQNLPEVVRKRIVQSHMSVENLSEYVKRLDRSMLRVIVLAHISVDRGDANQMREIIWDASDWMTVAVAKPGYTFNDDMNF